MHVEFKNSLDGEARAIFNFFRDAHSPKNWFWIPNISASLVDKIKNSSSLNDELKAEIRREIEPFHVKFRRIINEQKERIESEWKKEKFMESDNRKVICWLCLFLPGGLFNYKTDEIFAGVFRTTKNLVRVVKHETLHIVFWNETKNMSYADRERFIEEKLKHAILESQ